MMINSINGYNEKPESLGVTELDTSDLEMMCYLYQPVKPIGSPYSHVNYFIEDRLYSFIPMINDCLLHEVELGLGFEEVKNSYVYLTVKHLYVTPTYCANRPGWHTDGFGTEDINYTWCDKFPTLFNSSKFDNIDTTHTGSMKQFDTLALPENDYELPVKTLTRLTPFVVHTTPKVVTETMRTFFKLSISKHPYNLKGNSKNPILGDMPWNFHDRSEVRNTESFAGDSDFVVATRTKT